MCVVIVSAGVGSPAQNIVCYFDRVSVIIFRGLSRRGRWGS